MVSGSSGVCIAITAAAGTEVAGIRTGIAPGMDAARRHHKPVRIFCCFYDVGSISTVRAAERHTLDTVMDISRSGRPGVKGCCMGDVQEFQRLHDVAHPQAYVEGQIGFHIIADLAHRVLCACDNMYP